MTITTIILAHYIDRVDHLKRMVDDLLGGTVKPAEIIIFIDNPEIQFTDSRATIINSSSSFLPKIRFSLGTYFETDYCFFIDDDLSVREKTLDNFVKHADKYPGSVLGLEGSILGEGPTPYFSDTPVNRGSKLVEVDVVIRTYFVPTKVLPAGIQIQNLYPDLPRKSADDIYLSLGNKYLNNNKNFVIPVNESSDLTELGEKGVGQSHITGHYDYRNQICRALMDDYD